MRNRFRSSILAGVAAGVLGATVFAGPAGAQCCGDCNGDGTVHINEIVDAVGSALTGCPSALRPRIAVQDVDLSTVALTLDSRVTQGALSLTITTDADETAGALFTIAKAHAGVGVGLFRDGNFLRWDTTDASGLQEVVSVGIPNWQHGTHTIAVTWGPGEVDFVVDGVDAGPTTTSNVIIPGGADLVVGAPGTRTVYHQITFAALP